MIAGGGPAGAAAAIVLRGAGVAAELIERSRGPRDVVCGGFLGWDAIAALKRLGVDPASLGARPIRRLRLVAGERTVEADLPSEAAGLSRRCLDEALLQAAGGAARGVAVRAAEGRRLRLDDSAEVEADALFLATGKHELRGLVRPRDEHAAVGIRTALAAPRGLDGLIELHLFDGGYAGLLVQEDGSANLCISVERKRFADAGGPDALLSSLDKEAPRLIERLGDHGPWEAVAGVPYGWRAAATEPGVFRIGDQAAVIASLAGDGIAIALTSGAEAAAAYLSGGAAGAEAFQRRLAGRARRPLAVAGFLKAAAESPRWRGPLMRVASALPGLAPLAARLTRIA